MLGRRISPQVHRRGGRRAQAVTDDLSKDEVAGGGANTFNIKKKLRSNQSCQDFPQLYPSRVWYWDVSTTTRGAKRNI